MDSADAAPLPAPEPDPTCLWVASIGRDMALSPEEREAERAARFAAACKRFPVPKSGGEVVIEAEVRIAENRRVEDIPKEDAHVWTAGEEDE